MKMAITLALPLAAILAVSSPLQAKWKGGKPGAWDQENNGAMERGQHGGRGQQHGGRGQQHGGRGQQHGGRGAGRGQH
ncbi:hypothetical protein, partial [Thiolapillus sp.]|uniref:hypothetical protein n=1 Tax=Thiolapillus sp. TaxID=2017437 RepID=UPI0025FA6A3B